MSLNDFLTENKATLIEGHIDQIPQQVEELIKLSKNCKNIMEIGFNAGHSAEMFLKNNPDLTMTSFDLGQWGCSTW